jgi:8-oxo-dGTP pyrophosphatase MutT (NUDIX family)
VKLLDGALRLAFTSLHYFLRASWFVLRPNTFGAHAFAVTPDGKLVLVKLRYARGWRLPGGGRKKGEAPVDAALRELREEIGMTSHGEVTPAGDLEDSVYFKRDTASLVVVRDVRYRPRWSWEVEAVCEADPGALPDDMPPKVRSWIEQLRQSL